MSNKGDSRMISKNYKTPEDFYKDEREMDLKGYHLTYYRALNFADGTFNKIVATYHLRSF
jgi:hypothetical protein